MCGITGVYSRSLGSVEREVFEQLLMMNVFRGEDSTGVVRINNITKGKPIATVKRAVMPSPMFLSQKAGHDFIYDLDKKENKDNTGTIGYIGHCRAATKGDIKISNAHPFRSGDIIGVHNGTIRRAFKGSDAYETDSEALFALINSDGIEAALNEIAGADPAYALSFVNLKDRTLNFIKNDRRPLYFTYLYGKTTLLWSSERGMMEFILDRRTTKLATTSWAPDVGSGGYFTLKDNNLLSIPLGESPEKATLTALEIKKPPTVTYTSGYSGFRGPNYYESWDSFDTGGEGSSDGYGNFRQKHGDLSDLPWLQDEQEESKTSGSSGTSSAKDGANKGSTGSSLIVMGGSEKPEHSPQQRANEHKGEPLTQSERNFRLSQGCFCCGVVISPSDYDSVSKVRWWNREHYACGSCYSNDSGDTSWVAICIDDDVKIQENKAKVGVSVH